MSSQLHMQWHHINSLKSALEGVFTAMEMSKQYYKRELSLESWSLNVYQDTTAQLTELSLIFDRVEYVSGLGVVY